MREENLSQLCTWDNAEYVLHPNLNNHNRCGMPFGYGIAHCKSRKPKLNTKSSAEAEVGSANYYTLYNICKYLFMEDQGYDIKRKILFQNNRKAKKNGEE